MFKLVDSLLLLPDQLLLPGGDLVSELDLSDVAAELPLQSLDDLVSLGRNERLGKLSDS